MDSLTTTEEMKEDYWTKGLISRAFTVSLDNQKDKWTEEVHL